MRLTLIQFISVREPINGCELLSKSRLNPDCGGDVLIVESNYDITNIHQGDF